MDKYQAYGASFHFHNLVWGWFEDINASQLKYLAICLGAMQAWDLVPDIRIHNLEQILLSVLSQHYTIPKWTADLIFEILQRDHSIENLSLEPSVAEAMMTSKDNASAHYRPRWTSWNLSHRQNFFSDVHNRLPNVHNVKVLTLPWASGITNTVKLQELWIWWLNTTVVSPNWKIWWIWNDDELPGVQQWTIINPGPLFMSPWIKLDKADDLVLGSWIRMKKFITRMWKELLVKEMIKAKVVKVEKWTDWEFNVTFEDSSWLTWKDQFDIVLFWPGGHINIPFSNKRIRQVDQDNNELKHKTDDTEKIQNFTWKNTNLSIHRWQWNPNNVGFIQEKLSADPDAELLFFGFWNSTIWSILYCMENDIKFRVISDNPMKYFHEPNKSHSINGKNKRLWRVLNPKKFNPQEGISHDFLTVKSILNDLLLKGLIETDIEAVKWSKEHWIQYATLRKADGSKTTIHTIDECFCLYGYKPDTNAIDDLVEIDSMWKTRTDWTHQCIDKETWNALPWLFVHWLASFWKNNAILPWIADSTPWTMFAALLHTLRLHKKRKVPIVSLTQKTNFIGKHIMRKIQNKY